MKVESEKVGLKLSIQKTKIMASGPITSWEIDGETVSDFIFSASESLQMVTAAMKLKDACFLEKKLMSNLDSILKSRNIALPTKVHPVKAMVYPVVMYGCELSAEELMLLNCWRRLLRVPWTARRSNQSIQGDQSWVFIGRTDTFFQYFDHLMQKMDSWKKP